MKLLYEPDDNQKKALCLSENESIWYCVPFDLIYDSNEKKIVESYNDGKWYLVVTDERMIILDGDGIHRQYMLSECEEIKCETQVGSGIIVVKINGIRECAVRFSMRHIVRISYVARGADILAKGEKIKITSHEYERYCEKCGRAMPGTSKCPRCDGKSVMLKKFYGLCNGYMLKLLLISAFMIMASVISMIIPKVQKDFLDEVLKEKTGDLSDVGIFVLTILILNGILICINIAKSWWCRSLGTLISMDLRKKVYNKIQILSLSFINKRKPGELMNRVTGDTVRIRNFMENVFGGMLSTLFTMIASFTMMLFIDVKMTLYSTVLIVVVIVVTKLFWNYIHKIFHMQWVKDDKMRSGLQDVISGMRVVKAFGREEAESRKFAGYADAFAKVNKRNETFFAIFYPLLTFIMGMGTYVAVLFGGMNVLNEKMDIGDVFQFMAYSGYLFGPLGWMTWLPRNILDMLTSLNRIYDVLDEEPAIRDKSDAKEMKIEGDVDFENVCFGYNSYDPVIENISFSVKKGEMIGIVGASGTGKSTLINLIMRLYDTDRGRILVDKTDIKDIKKECLHSQIGVVLQETFLFSGTILNNIRFAKQNATYEEVIKAAKAANAHDFICRMPDGYNTYVGEHGYNISGGERQRIAIARAILNNPRLLILDEATSALDTESEYLIQQALDRLTEGRTTFAIAHRLSTLRNADRIVVIDGHNVAEIGSHNELLEKKGIYYGLVNAQLEMAADTAAS